MRILFLLLLLWLTASCTKDRIFEENKNNSGSDTLVVTSGLIVINEFVAKGATLTNELGINDDWIELYNPNNKAVTMKDGFWYITDDAVGNKTKFKLPEITIPPNGFYLIFADGQNKVLTQVHTNFGLSSAGEHVGLFYKPSTGDILKVDDRSYGPQTIDNQSEGRSPDGSSNWTVFPVPTPGESNM